MIIEENSNNRIQYLSTNEVIKRYIINCKQTIHQKTPADN